MENIQNDRYLKAKERVKAVKDFYSNLIAYCVVIPILVYINYLTVDFPWVIFPILGWGFGLLMHGLEVYGYNRILGKDWEQRKIREFMNDEKF